MDRKEFERVAGEVVDSLPEMFQRTMDNVHIVVEDVPEPGRKLPGGVRKGSILLGLYEGVPLHRRDTSYGMYPVVPDKITLYQTNIEEICTTDQEIRAKIREVLIHEIGHYYGMSEAEIRRAGY